MLVKELFNPLLKYIDNINIKPAGCQLLFVEDKEHLTSIKFYSILVVNFLKMKWLGTAHSKTDHIAYTDNRQCLRIERLV